MKKNILMGAAIGTAAMLSAGAMAGYLAWKNPAYAEVVSVRPVIQPVRRLGRVCYESQSGLPKPSADEIRLEGTVIDGMAGGVVVRPFGDEAPARATTATARPVEKKPDDGATVAATRHCRTSARVVREIVAYVVHYRLSGRTAKVRMDHDPGLRLPVRDGKVVLTQEAVPRPEPKS